MFGTFEGSLRTGGREPEARRVCPTVRGIILSVMLAGGGSVALLACSATPTTPPVIAAAGLGSSGLPAEPPFGEDCVDAAHERDDYPYVTIGGRLSIADQVQLFPGDKVHIVGAGSHIRRVNFGVFWQDYSEERDREYTAAGSGPIAPKFDFGDQPPTDEFAIKFRISYRCYRDQKRDLRVRP